MHKLKIDNNVKVLLSPFEDKKILLNFDDGVGVFSVEQATCGLAVLFDLIIVDNNYNSIDYNYKIQSDIGNIYMKEYSSEFLDQNNSLIQNENGSISLTGEYSGIIDGNVRIKDYSNEHINTKPLIKGDVLN